MVIQSIPEWDRYFALISDIAARFLALPSAEHPGPVIAASLAELCPRCYPVYSRMDSESKSIVLEALGNENAITAAALKTLNIEIPFQMPLDAERIARLYSAEIVHLPGDLNEILVCMGGAESCTRVSEELNIEEIAIVPYIWGGECYGASPVVCPEGAIMPPDEILITFGRLAAGTLRRYKAEAALVENEEKYRALFIASGDGVLFLKDGSIVDANAKAVELFGAGSVEKLRGLHPGHLSPFSQPDGTGEMDSHTLACRVMREAEEGALFPFEWACRGLNGRYFDAELSLSPVEIRGEVYLYCIIRDISQRKRSEAAILASEERFRQVAESSFNAIVTCDTAGIIAYASPSVERVLGYSPSEITGTVFSSLYLSPEDGKEAMDLLYSVMEGDVINGRQFVFTGSNGRILHLSLNANRLCSGGKVTGAMAIIQDISDTYRACEAEKEVQFRNYLFSAGFEDNPLGMALLFISPDETRIVEWNVAMETLSGWEKEEIIGSTLEDILPEDAPVKEIGDLICRTHSSGQPQTMRTECLLGGGNSRNLIWESALIADPRGEGVYVMLIVCDDTQRVRFEAEIIESEERYRNMTDAIGEPMLAVAPDLTVLLVNQAFRMFYAGLGFPEDATGQLLPDLYPALTETDTASIRRVFEKGEFVKSTRSLVLGSVPIRAEVTLVPIFRRGVVVQAVILLRDITAEYEIEVLKKEAFVQIEKNMEQLAILNDHIRNPLQGILGICELEGMKNLTLIRRQVEEIDHLIKRLDIGYLESEKVRDFLRKHYGVLDS